LEHALYRLPVLIQIADIGGGYFVGGMIMLVGTIAAKSLNGSALKLSVCVLSVAFILFAVIYYGVSGAVDLRSAKGSKFCIAALQGNIPVRLDGGQEQAEKTFQQFIDLTRQAVRTTQQNSQPLDLVIFPETVCPIPALVFEGSVQPADLGLTDSEAADWNKQLQGFVRELQTPVLFGLSAYIFEDNPEPKRLNSALFIDPKTDRTDCRYDKTQLVMFGEYIPFSEYLPANFFLKTLCQEAGRGRASVAMPLADSVDVSVNICFESTIPHFIRNQILTLKKQGRNPAILINISNDGWFHFSQQIDQHLATHVFRAVENRRPYITATNGGFSAIIDNRGVIQKIGKRKEAEAVIGLVSVVADKTPIYHRLGDWPAFVCMVFLLLFSLLPLNKRKEQKNVLDAQAEKN
jgi:apolipoprotein N-acyltransferase